MSSSDPNSKIDFLDSPSVVVSKINAAHCEKGSPKDNGILAFVRRVIVPIGELKRSQGRASERTWVKVESAVFSVGELSFDSADELDQAWEAGKIEEKELKTAVAEAIIALLEPIQKDLENDEAFRKAEEAAYPPEVAEKDEKDALLGVDEKIEITPPAATANTPSPAANL